MRRGYWIVLASQVVLGAGIVLGSIAPSRDLGDAIDLISLVTALVYIPTAAADGVLVAEGKGYHPYLGLCLGVLLGALLPVGLIVLVLLPSHGPPAGVAEGIGLGDEPGGHRTAVRQRRTSCGNDVAGEVRYYLGLAREGDGDAAFHGLLDLPGVALPALSGAYAVEPDPALRALLIEATWRRREPSGVGLLATALGDPGPEVWKRALDGLVTVGTPEARRVVEEARDRLGCDEESRGWLDEAILQIDEASPA